MNILTGDQARLVLDTLLSDTQKITFNRKEQKFEVIHTSYYQAHREEYLRVKGYYFDPEQNLWIAFDNTTFECYVESFTTKKKPNNS